MADDEDDEGFGAPPVDPRVRVWDNPTDNMPVTAQERAQFGIPEIPIPKTPTPNGNGASESAAAANSAVLAALVNKFPEFNPAWPAKTQIAWFASFEQLMKAGLK